MRAMKVTEETIALLGRALHGTRVPRVRALHLPPAPWNGTREGEFGALELDDGSLGLSYVLLGSALGRFVASDARDTRETHRPGTGATAADLVGADALDVARHWAGADAALRTIGFAAVNALTRHVFDRAGFVPPDY